MNEDENDQAVDVAPLPAEAIDVEVIDVPEGTVVLHVPDVVELDPSVRDAQGTGDQTGGMGPL